MSFGSYAAALHTAHAVADHWVQSDWQAQHKADDGREGWKALTGHVGSYVVAQTLTVAAVSAGEGAWPTAKRFTAALAVSALAHGWADRRAPLKALADRLGKASFYAAGTPPVGHGGYQLDQSWHLATSVFLPALILSAGGGDGGQ